MRNFSKIKQLSDYKILDAPEEIKNTIIPNPICDIDNYILRMLVKPKYGNFKIPKEIQVYEKILNSIQQYDIHRTGINESWCYLTIRSGITKTETDSEWHFDGSSFRTDVIPERNYIWVSDYPTQYKLGQLYIPDDFNPLIHDMFSFASKQLERNEILTIQNCKWYLISPFCLHRKPQISVPINRTFIRISFTDIEIRDINNTMNPLIPTYFYERNPIKTFRNKLLNYYEK